MKQQLETAKRDVLTRSRKREKARDYVNPDLYVAQKEEIAGFSGLFVIGTYEYLWQQRDTNLRQFPVVIGSSSDTRSDGEPKIDGGIIKTVLRKQAPLRLIIRRFPEGLTVREELECGHWHTYYGPSWETKSKRRRCHECLRPPKKPMLWESSSGTAEQFVWSIQRKTRILL